MATSTKNIIIDDADKPNPGANAPRRYDTVTQRRPVNVRAWLAVALAAVVVLGCGGVAVWSFAAYKYQSDARFAALVDGSAFVLVAAVVLTLGALLWSVSAGAVRAARRVGLVEWVGGAVVDARAVRGLHAPQLMEMYAGHMGVEGRYADNSQFQRVTNFSGQLGAPAVRGEIVDALPVPALPELDPFDAALDTLPRLVDLETIIDNQPSAFSVPFGVDQDGAYRWLDMRKDMLHAGIFGATGAGKDNLLESWFVALTRQNTPDQVQFAVLDGKGHWTQPTISKRAHFWLPPAGGIGDEGQAALQATLKAIQDEAKRRGQLVFGADCDTMERYVLKTGQRMPYLVVFVSDVMGNIVGDVDKLLVDLVSKARALGIRVVVSMQTPTKQNTQWRSNLSTVICGQLQGRSNDAPALGIGEKDILFPPSQLPDPKTRPGVFSVRAGRDQWLIQAPLARRDYMARYIDDLPTKAPKLLTKHRADTVARASVAVKAPTSGPVFQQERIELYLKKLVLDGKSRADIRAWCEANGLKFDNGKLTKVRSDLGLSEK